MSADFFCVDSAAGAGAGAAVGAFLATAGDLPEGPFGALGGGPLLFVVDGAAAFGPVGMGLEGDVGAGAGVVVFDWDCDCCCGCDCWAGCACCGAD